MIYSTNWYGEKTFRMIPIEKACPFNEVIYDPKTKILAIVSKEFKEKPQMFPKLNDKGSTILVGSTKSDPNNPKYVEERRFMDTYYEYYIDNLDDINEFVKFFASNYNHPALQVLIPEEGPPHPPLKDEK